MSLPRLGGVALQPAVPVVEPGQYFYTTSPGGAATSAAHGIGSLRLFPWVVGQRLRLSRLGGEVTVIGDVGSKVRLGIYADNGRCYPGALVVDAGQIAGDSATVQELTIDTVLLPGLYWVGGAVQAVTTTQPTVRTQSSSWHQPVAVGLGTTIPAAGGGGGGYAATGITGALPASFPSTVSTFPTSGVRLFAKAA